MNMVEKYEPFSVTVVIRDSKKIFLLSGENKYSLPSSVGQNGENPQKCARRIVLDTLNVEPGRIISLPYVSRIPISSFSEEIRASWPKGARTIPSYAFICEVEELGEGVEKERVPELEFSAEENGKILQISAQNGL